VLSAAAVGKMEEGSLLTRACKPPAHNQPFRRGCEPSSSSQSPRLSGLMLLAHPLDNDEAGVVRLRNGPLLIIKGRPRDSNPRHHDNSSDNQPLGTNMHSFEEYTLDQW